MMKVDTLHSQKLHIPNLWPAFEGWRKGVNPCYSSVTGGDEEEEGAYGEDVHRSTRLRRAIDGRLEGLIADEKMLMKAKAVDIGLFACWYVSYFLSLSLFIWLVTGGLVLLHTFGMQIETCTAILASTEGSTSRKTR